MALPVTRRSLLRTVAGTVGVVGLGGCREAIGAVAHGTRPSSGARSSPSSASKSGAQTGPVTLSVLSFGPAGLPNVSGAFAKQHPGIRLVQADMPNTYYVNMLTGQNVVLSPGQYAPLDAALRAANFDPTVLASGSLEPFVLQGHTIALPFTAIPWAVQWRTDAFTAAGLPSPSPDWAFDDFRDACAALSSLAASGRVKGLQGALAPLVGDPAPGAREWYPSALTYPGLWQAFVWGFGGTIVNDGQYRLTDSSSMKGFTNIVDLARQYSVSQAAAMAGGYALSFNLYRPGQLPAGWQWARLPRFPEKPVIPTVSVAQGLAYRSTAPGTPPPPEASMLSAAVEYLLWWYTPAATSLLMAESTPPALAGAAEQESYWKSKTGGAPAVGDWANFQDCYSGLPSAPDAIMYDAINHVVTGKADIQDALATAQKNMNNEKFRPGSYFIAEPQIGVQ